MFKAYYWDLGEDAVDFLIAAFKEYFGADGEVLERDPEEYAMDYYNSDSNAAVILVALSEATYFSYSNLFQDNLYTSKKFIRHNGELDGFLTDVARVMDVDVSELTKFLPVRQVEKPVAPVVSGVAGGVTGGDVPTSVDDLLNEYSALVGAGSGSGVGSVAGIGAGIGVVDGITTNPPQGTADVQALLDELESLRKRHDNVSTANVRLLSERDALKEELTQVKAEKDKFVQLLTVSKGVIEGLKSTSYTKEEFDEMESRLLSAQGTARDLERKLDKSDTALLEKERELALSEKALAEEREKTQGLSESLANAQRELELEKEKTNIDDIKVEMEEIRNTYVAENDKLKQQVAELNEELTKNNNKIIELGSQLSTGANVKGGMPDRFAKFSKLGTQPPPVPRVFKKVYSNIRFIFTGSSHSTRSVYSKLQTEIKKVTQDKSKKVIFVDLSPHSFSYYRFGTQTPPNSTEWLENGGDIRKYAVRGTKGAGERELYYSLGHFASYVNEFAFHFINFDARFSELNALNEEVIVYLGDATTGFGTSMFASLVASNKVEVLLSSETFSIGAFYSLVLGVKPKRENLTIRFYDYSKQVQKYYDSFKNAGYNLSIYDRRTRK